MWFAQAFEFYYLIDEFCLSVLLPILFLLAVAALSGVGIFFQVMFNSD